MVAQVGSAPSHPVPEDARPVAVRVDNVNHEFPGSRQRNAPPVRALAGVSFDAAPQTSIGTPPTGT